MKVKPNGIVDAYSPGVVELAKSHGLSEDYVKQLYNRVAHFAHTRAMQDFAHVKPKHFNYGLFLQMPVETMKNLPGVNLQDVELEDLWTLSIFQKSHNPEIALLHVELRTATEHHQYLIENYSDDWKTGLR